MAAEREHRRLLTPRWLLGAVVLVAFVIATIWLGRWQWQRTQDILAVERAAQSSSIPIEQALSMDGNVDAAVLPTAAQGHPVTVTGRYLPLQVAVTQRLHDGGAGVWIVTGLQLPDDRIVAVVRGSLPTKDAPGSVPPDGTVQVAGVLQPNETFYLDAVTPAGTVASISSAQLARIWDAALVPGFVVMTAQEPMNSPAPEMVKPTAQASGVPFPLQNFFYAFQWWFIGALAVFLFVRWLWLESRRAPTSVSSSVIDPDVDRGV